MGTISLSKLSPKPFKNNTFAYLSESIHSVIVIGASVGGSLAGLSILYLTKFLVTSYPKLAFFLILATTCLAFILSTLGTLLGIWISYHWLKMPEEDKKYHYIPWK